MQSSTFIALKVSEKITTLEFLQCQSTGWLVGQPNTYHYTGSHFSCKSNMYHWITTISQTQQTEALLWAGMIEWFLILTLSQLHRVNGSIGVKRMSPNHTWKSGSQFKTHYNQQKTQQNQNSSYLSYTSINVSFNYNWSSTFITSLLRRVSLVKMHKVKTKLTASLNHSNDTRLRTWRKFGKNDVCWTGKVEIKKGEILGNRQSKNGNSLTYSRHKIENLWYLWVHSIRDLNFCVDSALLQPSREDISHATMHMLYQLQQPHMEGIHHVHHTYKCIWANYSPCFWALCQVAGLVSWASPVLHCQSLGQS